MVLSLKLLSIRQSHVCINLLTFSSEIVSLSFEAEIRNNKLRLGITRLPDWMMAMIVSSTNMIGVTSNSCCEEGAVFLFALYK